MQLRVSNFSVYIRLKQANVWSPYCRGVTVAQRQMKRARATERDIISAPWRYTADRHSADIIGKPRKLFPPMYRSKRGINKKRGKGHKKLSKQSQLEEIN